MVFLHLLSYSNLISRISLFFIHVISSGLSLFCVAFLNLTAFLTSLLVMSILQMFLHSPTIFQISSSLLVSGSGLSYSGSPKTIIFFLLFCLSLSSIPCPSVTFGLFPPLLCLCQLQLTVVYLLCPNAQVF